MRRNRRLVALGEAAFWVILSTAAYIAAQYIVAFFVWLLFTLGVSWDATSAVSLLMYRLAIYTITTALIALAVWYRDRALSFRDIALDRLLQWKDIGLSLAGGLLYIACTFVALTVANWLFSVNTSESQDLGFSQLYGTELLVAFVILVILTPIFEEILFRGFLYGRLRALTKHWWLPALLVSGLFGLAHGQWNVGIDVFCLSMVACALRELTGSIWAGILLHIMKNLVAFLVVFVFAGGIAG